MKRLMLQFCHHRSRSYLIVERNFVISDFFDFLNHDFYRMESVFKNMMLTGYYQEWLIIMDKTFAAFESEIDDGQNRWKKLLDKVNFTLRPGYGHPLNAGRLENVISEFSQVHSKCLNELTNACTRIEVSESKQYIRTNRCSGRHGRC